MTYEERKKWLCEQCGKTHQCGYVDRGLTDKCPRISEVMEGWELGCMDAIEKQVTKEYWLFTINFDNAILNCFFDFFPSKKDLKKASKGKEYAIIHTMQLTEEQFNKLVRDE